MNGWKCQINGWVCKPNEWVTSFRLTMGRKGNTKLVKDYGNFLSARQ